MRRASCHSRPLPLLSFVKAPKDVTSIQMKSASAVFFIFFHVECAARNMRCVHAYYCSNLLNIYAISVLLFFALPESTRRDNLPASSTQFYSQFPSTYWVCVCVCVVELENAFRTFERFALLRWVNILVVDLFARLGYDFKY